MEDLVIKIEDGGLWIEERHSKFEVRGWKMEDLES